MASLKDILLYTVLVRGRWSVKSIYSLHSHIGYTLAMAGLIQLDSCLVPRFCEAAQPGGCCVADFALFLFTLGLSELLHSSRAGCASPTLEVRVIV